MSSNSASRQVAVIDRLNIVDSIGTTGDGSDGQSLRGQNVAAFPEGVLMWVRDSNRLYKLKKNIGGTVADDTTGNQNVVASIGSSLAAGLWIAETQQATATLVANEGGSSVSIAGFDLSSGGHFHVSYVTPGGTQGFLHAVITNDHTVTVLSSNAGDTSVVFLTFYEMPEGE